jgi:hypothetical protein
MAVLEQGLANTLTMPPWVWPCTIIGLTPRPRLINRTVVTAAEIGDTIVNILERRLAAMQAELEKFGGEDHRESR